MGFETWDFILKSILFYFQNMYVGFDFLSATLLLLQLQVPSDFCLAFRFWEKTKTARFALCETAAFRDYLCTILEVG